MNQWSTFQKLLAKPEPEVPKGFKSAREWAGEAGVSIVHMQRLLYDGLARGTVKRVTVPRKGPSGLVRQLAYFAPLKT